MELRRYWAPSVNKYIFLLIIGKVSSPIVKHFIETKVRELIFEYNEKDDKYGNVNKTHLSTVDGEVYCFASSSRNWAETNAEKYHIKISTGIL